MDSLKDVIAVIREQLNAALAGHQALPGHIHLEAQRVVVTLHFGVESSGDGKPPTLTFATERAASTPNTLSLEFTCRTGSSIADTNNIAEVPAAGARPLTGSEADGAVQQLSRVFGAPGFDSAARATVFREALEGLSAIEIRMAVEPSISGKHDNHGEAVKRARALVQRVCQAGPSGANDGMKILAATFAEHEAVALLNLVADVWKTQEAWL